MWLAVIISVFLCVEALSYLSGPKTAENRKQE